MITKIGIALHLISSCINLEEELEVRNIMCDLKESWGEEEEEELSDWDESSVINDLSEDFSLLQHRGVSLCLDESNNVDFVKLHKLFEHRGKPDPEKEKAREESHLRGKERHKNALDRDRKEELLRKSREAQRKRNKNSSDDDDSQQQKQQKQQKQQSSIQSIESPTKQEKMLADTAINKAKKSHFQLSSFTKKMVSSAPTSNSKAHAKKMSKDIESLNSGFNNNINSAEAKLTPNELKRRKEKAREEMADKYDEIESKYMGKMDTPAERLWFKKNFSKLKRVGIGTVDNVCDMMGYKAVYTDIKNATKFLLGSGE